MKIIVDYYVDDSIETDVIRYKGKGKVVVQIYRGKRHKRGRVRLPNGDVYLYSKVVRIARKANK